MSISEKKLGATDDRTNNPSTARWVSQKQQTQHFQSALA